MVRPDLRLLILQAKNKYSKQFIIVLEYFKSAQIADLDAQKRHFTLLLRGYPFVISMPIRFFRLSEI